MSADQFGRPTPNPDARLPPDRHHPYTVSPSSALSAHPLLHRLEYHDIPCTTADTSCSTCLEPSARPRLFRLATRAPPSGWMFSFEPGLRRVQASDRASRGSCQRCSIAPSSRQVGQGAPQRNVSPRAWPSRSGATASGSGQVAYDLPQSRLYRRLRSYALVIVVSVSGSTSSVSG